MKPDKPLFLQSNQVLAIQAKHTFGRRVQKYWNLLPLETRKLGREGFKEEIKLIMTDKKYEQLKKQNAELRQEPTH